MCSEELVGAQHHLLSEIARLRAEVAEWRQAAGVEAGLRREFMEEADRLRVSAPV